ncbi:hypothetical protein GV64_07375 [Endozoicomonas elysicola]|uniref:TauD/TfdA-like domain-containing protein n=1 Tax=Endozoicomonas elysicola TaxID=305900 RepID=A0A081K8V7_9GAMM|nr:hypothetical protein GV64_07375 [Endozoicomonas elysicola]
MRVTPNSGALGAWVEGIDANRPLLSETFRELQSAFIRYKVLFFPNQNLATEAFLEFSSQWGKVLQNPYFEPLGNSSEITEIIKRPDDSRNIGRSWHMDFAFDSEPTNVNLLMAKKLPRQGGDTLFCDLNKAFKALSPGLQQTLKSLKVVNSNRNILHAAQHEEEFKGRLPKNNTEVINIHPAVIHNPDNGEDSLFISATATECFNQWSVEESKLLLDYLFAHVGRPDFCCRFSWEEGMVALWNNLYTLHYAVNDYPGEERIMHRIALAGKPLIAAC